MTPAAQVSIELFYNTITAIGGFVLIQSGKMSQARPVRRVVRLAS